jgi:glycosyltransferase involved in cell wall biosynthesis
MLKVGVISAPIDNNISGSALHLSSLLNEMKNSSAEYKITLIHYNVNSAEPLYEEMDELIIPRNPIKAGLIIARKKFDIIHYTNLSVFSPIIFVKAKKVATIHGCAAYYLPDQYPFHVRFHEKFIRPQLINLMDVVFTVSETSKKLIHEHDGFRKEDIVITYNGINKAYKVKNNNNIPSYESGEYILHISRYSERKNPWTILKAMKKLKDRGHSFRLLIVGSGWKNEKVVSFIMKHQLTDLIEILGFVNEKELVPYMRHAKIFIFPSLYEGFGIPNIEAMSCGIPVITTRVGAIPEVVKDGAIMLDDPMSEDELMGAIVNLWRNDKLRGDMIKRGEVVALKYSWEKSAKTVLSTYSKVVDNNDH